MNSPIDTSLITSILSAVDKKAFDVAAYQLEKLRTGGCPPAIAKVLGSFLQYSRTPGTNTARELVRAQTEGGVSFNHIAVNTWFALKQRPDIPPRLLRAYATFTVNASDTWADQIILRIVDLAGMAEASEADRQYLFDNLIVPLMERAAQRGRVDLLLNSEMRVYERVIWGRDNEAHFGACYKKLIPCLRQAGLTFGHQQKHLATPAAPFAKPRVAFFVHEASRLAHVDQLRDTLRAYLSQQDQPFEPIVICAFVRDEAVHRAFREDFDEIGITPIFLTEQPTAPLASMLNRLRQVLAEQACTALVFVSLVVWMAFIFAARFAPVQVWWSVKYHTFETPEIDAYIAGGQDATRLIHGRVWRTIPLAIQDWFDPELREPASKIRAELRAGERVILGCIAREQKLQSPEFLEAVCTILKLHPNCIFLWTGRQQEPSIAETFVKHGVQEQTRFIGWVDTKLYAQVLDIFLDCFPAPAGFTAFQAMAAGKPIVFFQVPEASQGVQGQISQLYFGLEGAAAQQERVATIFRKTSERPLYLLASTTDQYLHFASQLIADAGLRREVGEACKTFIEEFVSDMDQVGASFARCISDILAAKAGTSA